MYGLQEIYFLSHHANEINATGVILEYELRDKSREMKEIDLLHLTPE